MVRGGMFSLPSSSRVKNTRKSSAQNAKLRKEYKAKNGNPEKAFWLELVEMGQHNLEEEFTSPTHHLKRLVPQVSS